MRGDIQISRVVRETIVHQSIRQPVEGYQQKVPVKDKNYRLTYSSIPDFI